MSTIAVAGATGNLGHRIVKALLERGATVKALVRAESDPEKVKGLEVLGAQVVSVDMDDAAGLADALQGSDCLVSALLGLEDVIVGTQTALLNAAVAAGVKRFIPSDFSSDFTALPVGQNRNFDLRKKFKAVLDAADIQATSVFNGAFAEVLAYNPQMINREKKQVGFWEDGDYAMDFTTMDDTAAYTAAAALDEQAPRDLRIASFQVSANELAGLLSQITGETWQPQRLGSKAELEGYAQQQRAANPESEKEIFPRWQQMQYGVSMLSVQNKHLDNDRYPGLTWATAQEVLGGIMKGR